MTMAAITEHPELWACAVNIVGIVNFVTFLERTGAYRRALREAEYGSLERDREFLESISPIRKIDRIACPLMVIHGANDPRVPVGEAEQVVAALRARGAPGRVPALRGRGPRHHAPAEPPRLLPARGRLPGAAPARAVTCNAARMRFEADLEAARARIADAVVRTPVLAQRRARRGARLRRLAEVRAAAAHGLVQAARRDQRRARRCRPARAASWPSPAATTRRRSPAPGGAAGLPVTVVMNADANAAKSGGDARLRRDDRLRGRRSHQPRADRARRWQSATGWRFVHPFDDWNVIAGQGTATLELLEEVPRPGRRRDARSAAAGLLSGAALACRLASPGDAGATAPSRPHRPTRSARSPRAAACASTTRPSTIADGARTVQIGERTFAVLSELLRRHLARRRRRGAAGDGARLGHDASC